MRLLVPSLLAAALLSTAQPALANFIQTDELRGTGVVSNTDPHQGNSVALSAAGNTAIVGAPIESNSVGGVYVFIRNPTQSGVGAWTQQARLSGSHTQTILVQQGWSVALSADGNTAIWGGPGDNNTAGAAWVFTRSPSGGWTEQAKLVAADAIGNAQQGWSVALSADGNTALIGGFTDSNKLGAAWLWTRSGGVWSKQAKLVPFDASAGAEIGASVALSADGTLAIVGGPNDNNGVGAAWVFSTRNEFLIQEAKLVDSTSPAEQGASVALSGDGTTALVGGPAGDAAWVFTRSSAGVWTQQAKLHGSGAQGFARQGTSVAVSGGGNVAMVGGSWDNSQFGAAWVFTRSGGVWSQQGLKLLPTGAVGRPLFGQSVALSCNTAFVGGPEDNNSHGAAWVFSAPATATHDFGGKNDGFFPTAADCMSDILWYNFNTGQVVNWLLNGATVIGGGSPGQTDPAMWAIVGQRDFNGDGTNDILWRNSTSGDVVLWALNGPNVLPFPASRFLGTKTTDFAVVGTGDFDGNGFGDILWFNTATRAVSIWFMDETLVPTEAQLSMQPPPPWTIAGTGDFNGDGMTDIIWSATSNGQVQVLLWFMNGATQIGGGPPVPPGSSTPLIPPTPWTIAGTGDFNGDGFSDILWHNPSGGQVLLWLMNGTTVNPASGSPVLRTRNAGSSTAPAISTATVSATSCGCNPLRFRAGVTNLRSCSGSLAARR